MTVPPGWPPDVPPPGTPEWEHRAVGWLFDLCPGEYRGYPVVNRYPVVLARLTARHLDGAVRGTRDALSAIRVDLAGTVPPAAVTEVVDVLEREQARLLAARRGVDLIEQALRGRRFVPRL